MKKILILGIVVVLVAIVLPYKDHFRAMILCYKAARFIRQGEYDKAIVMFEKFNPMIVKTQPELLDSYSYVYPLGLCYTKVGRYEDAVKLLEKAVELKPDSPSGFSVLGIAYSETNRTDEAIETIKKAIELRHDSSYDYSNLGGAYCDAKRYQESIDSYKKAIKIDPNFAIAYSGLGITYCKIGDYNKAEEVCKKALQLNPGLKEAQDLSTFLSKKH